MLDLITSTPQNKALQKFLRKPLLQNILMIEPIHGPGHHHHAHILSQYKYGLLHAATYFAVRFSASYQLSGLRNIEDFIAFFDDFAVEPTARAFARVLIICIRPVTHYIFYRGDMNIEDAIIRRCTLVSIIFQLTFQPPRAIFDYARLFRAPRRRPAMRTLRQITSIFGGCFRASMLGRGFECPLTISLHMPVLSRRIMRLSLPRGPFSIKKYITAAGSHEDGATAHCR